MKSALRQFLRTERAPLSNASLLSPLPSPLPSPPPPPPSPPPPLILPRVILSNARYMASPMERENDRRSCRGKRRSSEYCSSVVAAQYTVCIFKSRRPAAARRKRKATARTRGGGGGGGGGGARAGDKYTHLHAAGLEMQCLQRTVPIDRERNEYPDQWGLIMGILECRD